MKRITSDIDTKNKLYLVYTIYKGLTNIKKIEKIEIQPSNKKGYHLTFWTTQNYSKKNIFLLRAKINDDKHRINLDKKRKIGQQVFFYTKIKPHSQQNKQQLLRDAVKL
jgi:hypothetical protein